jgi:hypothetical protein
MPQKTGSLSGNKLNFFKELSRVEDRLIDESN